MKLARVEEPGSFQENLALTHRTRKDTAESIRMDWPRVDNRRKTNCARLIQKVYKVHPVKCVNCGGRIRIVALVDDAAVIERSLKLLSVGDPPPEARSRAPAPIRPGPKARPLPSTGTRYRISPEQPSEATASPGHLRVTDRRPNYQAQPIAQTTNQTATT